MNLETPGLAARCCCCCCSLSQARRGTAAAPAGGVGPAGHEVFPADDDTPFPPSAFLATVVAARPTRLLVLSR